MFGRVLGPAVRYPLVAVTGPVRYPRVVVLVRNRSWRWSLYAFQMVDSPSTALICAPRVMSPAIAVEKQKKKETQVSFVVV